MADLKQLADEISDNTDMYFQTVVIPASRYCALIECAEALEQLVKDYGDVPFDNGDTDGQQVMNDAEAALAKLKAAP